MVQFANFFAELPNNKSAMAATVKSEIEDPLEEEYGPLNKRPKSPSQFYQWGADARMVRPESAHCSLLEEPSPLGLRLRKSPSLLDLIQMRLSQGNSATLSNVGFETGKKMVLKASNFPVSVLRIGSWESVSRYEGDLVAKCYYAKHKLVWEVLNGGLKSKIEIQWSDITALRASCPENGPGTLDIMVARQPLFFRETNPQPRKHTLWQATSDFTNGQASMHRRHFLQCPPGLLNKHFEKLTQCDPRLNSLSRQPDAILECPYFEPRCSAFDDHCNAPTQNLVNETEGLVNVSDTGEGRKMAREESYGELLMHLPRIASLPQFLFNITDDSER